MKKFFALSLGLAAAAVTPGRAADSLLLRYEQPAERWTEALPVGNGRLGAMVFGGVATEHLQLNEATLWSGAPSDWNNPAAKEILPQVRAAIFAGDYLKAGELCKRMQAPTTSPTSRSARSSSAGHERLSLRTRDRPRRD